MHYLFAVVRKSRDELWGCKWRRPAKRSQVFRWPEQATESKVAELDDAVVAAEHILGLEIAVRNSPRVQVFDRI